MAKKSTVGGPKARRTTAEDLERRKQYLSKAEKEQRFQRRVMYVLGAVIVISIIVLIWAVTNEQIIRPRQWITKVNGQEVSTQDFQERVRYKRWTTAEDVRYIYAILGGDPNQVQQYAGEQITNLRYPSLMGEVVLTEMEEDLIIEQWAEAYGIEVDDAQIDATVDEYMAQRVGLTVPGGDTPTPTLEPTLTLTPLVSPTPSNTPAPTATLTLTPTEEGAEAEAPEEGPTATPTATLEPTATFTPTATLQDDQIMATVNAQQDTYFGDVTDGTDIDRDAVRSAFYYQALRDAMLEKIGESVEAEELQVQARHILISFNPDLDPGTAPPPTDDQKAAALARAEEVMDALQNGEPFADLAKAVSDDTGSAVNGGDLGGWTSPDNYVEAFKDTVLTADIGAIVGPVETEFGYHIIQVNGREIRPLTASELTNRQNQAFLDWLDEEKSLAEIERRSDWRDRVPDDPSYNSLLGDILPIQ